MRAFAPRASALFRSLPVLKPRLHPTVAGQIGSSVASVAALQNADERDDRGDALHWVRSRATKTPLVP